jgi:thymidylate synthase (FAD)
MERIRLRLGDDLVHVADTAFNNHARNTEHISPFDTGIIQVGVDGLEVRLLQGIDFASLKRVVARGTRATIGLPRPLPDASLQAGEEVADEDWQEMFKGGLQTALESQVLVFEVWGASRVLTHQIVRSRRAGFHQQSQRATWYGDRPEVRMPETIWRAPAAVRSAWMLAYMDCWSAYRLACNAGVPYEDARYILPEGTVNYIQCEYTVREFLNVFAYRGCSMFLREMVHTMRLMRAALLEQSPWMEPYVKISCEKGALCWSCGGSGKFSYQNPTDPDTNDREWVSGLVEGSDCPICNGLGGARKCTFQGWENVEKACDFPWAKEDNRVFLASPRLRIGAS